MRRFLLTIAGMATAALLASCGGPTVTTTRYVLPESPGGRLCIVQCQSAQNFCKQRCDFDRRACSNDMQAQAMRDYDKYAREQMSVHAQIDLHPRDFERPEMCSPALCYKACERPYQSCYKNCGGQVVTSTSCQAFCS